MQDNFQEKIWGDPNRAKLWEEAEKKHSLEAQLFLSKAEGEKKKNFNLLPQQFIRCLEHIKGTRIKELWVIKVAFFVAQKID